MTGFSEWRLFANDTLVAIDSFLLNIYDSLTISFPANGKSYRIEVDQSQGHPFNRIFNAVVEECGYGSGTFFGYVANVPQNDDYSFYEKECAVVTGSFDPNDKHVSPKGITPQNFISEFDELEYHI